MIQREYYQGIDITAPSGYFGNWYADVWRRRINSHVVAPGRLRVILIDELDLVGATIEYSQYSKFKVTFVNDSDYTAFVLRWS